MLLITICLIAVVTAQKVYYHEEKAEELFEQFIKDFNKVYPHDEEKNKRFQIFKDNLKEINRLNDVDDAEFRINKFTDLTSEEMRTQYMGLAQEYPYYENHCTSITDSDLKGLNVPPELDYRLMNVVTEVKTQERCGSCWIFASIGSIESNYALKHGNLISLSEQQLLDCLKCSSPNCLDGGLPIIALSELVTSGGIVREVQYPYISEKQQCHLDWSRSGVKVTACYEFQMKDETKLKEVLFQFGPIVIGINGEGAQHYHGGVYTVKGCPNNTPIDHAVLLVGYGSTQDGKPYWLVKNSWGTGFGEKGYMRMLFGQNTCGLMNSPAVSAVVA